MAKSKKHPDKDIREAVEYAESKGWTLRLGTAHGHSWGILRCPTNEECRCGQYCSVSVWGTPKTPATMVAKILRAVNNCTAENAPPAEAAPEPKPKKTRR